MFKAISTAFTLLLTACATSSGTKTFTPMSLDDDQSAVYIYRPSVMANAMYTPDLYINEELKFSIKNGKKSRITLPAGEYTFVLDADNNQSRLTTQTLDLKPGMTYYLRVTTSLKIKDTAKYEPYQRSYNLENIAQEQAKLEITECCMKSDKKPIVEPETNPTNKPEDGFSVDKTQNPFSD